MKILVFPGQGSQKIGMGKLFYENFSIANFEVLLTVNKFE